MDKNKQQTVRILHLGMNLYKPTYNCLKYFLPRMAKGSIIAFNELNNEDWPGETKALLEKFNLKKVKIDCFSYEPNISYIVIK